MKRIRTLKQYALIVCALVATFNVGSAIAADDDKGPKAKVVFDRALPNVPGKSMKGILVEYGPGEASPAHIHPKSAFTYATILEGAVRAVRRALRLPTVPPVATCARARPEAL